MEVAILCGGKGKRMNNANKGLLTICGKTFIEALYEELKSLGKVYIIGRKRDFKHLNIPAYDDTFPNLGPLGGVYTAFNIIESEYILFVPCDMPTFKKDHAIFLEEALLENYADISIFYTDRITPIPGVYRRNLKELIRKRLNTKNLSIIDLVKTQKTVVSVVKELNYFENINTPEDYEKLLLTIRCK